MNLNSNEQIMYDWKLKSRFIFGNVEFAFKNVFFKFTTYETKSELKYEYKTVYNYNRNQYDYRSEPKVVYATEIKTNK